MPIKVELHSDIVRFVRHECSDAEVDEFYAGLERIRRDPLASEAIADPRLSRYMLRFFRFGSCVAIFRYDPGRETIKVLECRKVRPSPGEERRRRHDDAGP
jgi:hypothetical protein